MRGSLDLRDEGLIHDLIGRPSRAGAGALPADAFAGESVLITGAGGSVGAELARQVAARRPDRLVILDQSEYALFRIEQELRERFGRVTLRPVLGDVTRRRELADVFAQHRPDAVFHAAAYKHVGMLERDVLAAARANVVGTLNTAALTRRSGARFLLISTDKAANARSILGATKRLAELAVLAEPGAGAEVAVVRFGNVAGSSGSVLEIMVDRLRRGVPLQVTDPRATRYFMSGSEAVSLVLRADRLRRNGDIFWLEMGEPIRILDLARRLIDRAAASGLRPVPIEFIGLRPGEKLREELTVQGLEMVGTGCDGIWIARQAPCDRPRIRAAIRDLRAAIRERRPARALAAVEAAVPEYVASPEARRAAAEDEAGYRLAGASVRGLDTGRPAPPRNA